MAIEQLELHYHLADNSHAMNAVVRNKSEAEALAVFLHIATELGIPIQLESSALQEGGLTEIWKFIGKNNNQLTLLLAVIVMIFSRFPVSDPEMGAMNKELTMLNIEEKKLNIKKLKYELQIGYPEQETISAAARVLEHDIKVATRRSNFYQVLLDYDKVTAVGFTPIPDSNVTPKNEYTVRQYDFSKFVLITNILPVKVVDNARIEIVAPVLKEGNYQWKGIYSGQPITFKMLDQAFKTSVLRRDVSFKNGCTIDCVLNIHRKFDAVGNIYIVGYSVATVLSQSDGVKFTETYQGKRYRFKKELVAAQVDLFDQNP